MDLEIFVLFLLEAECANALTHKSVFQEATTHTHNTSKTNTAFLNVTWLHQLGYSESTHLDHLQSQRDVKGSISRF